MHRGHLIIDRRLEHMDPRKQSTAVLGAHRNELGDSSQPSGPIEAERSEPLLALIVPHYDRGQGPELAMSVEQLVQIELERQVPIEDENRIGS
ncbi:MAG: hypothetical protein V3T14_10135, partial [Myxococcota bacterium]